MSSIDELLAAAEADVTRGWLPACQVAVARDGKLAAFATFGDATDDTRFAVFSATKPIVAAAAWVLMGEGLLDVARPVADYVPEFATHGKHAVTVEQVMLHTAGFPSPTLLAEGAHPVMRRRGFAEWPLEWEPGTRFEYHGVSAHWVLAELIERLGGMDFRDFVEQRVTSPLGLPRLLGIPPARHDACATVVPVGDMVAFDGFERAVNGPAFREAGVPGAGAFATAAELALFYQGLLHDREGIWHPEVLHDVTTNVRCNFPDPLLGVPVQRTLGLVLAGDDGQHELRYALFGAGCSPRSFGHAGAHAQVAWADPASGISFAYVTSGLDANELREVLRGNALAGIASALDL
jgi:CubicO group peptidase (beta-lactamase class C family)